MEVGTSFSTRINNNLLEGWKSVDANGKDVGTPKWELAPEYSIERYFSIVNRNALFFVKNV
ncbi:MAG: hypothetical protein AAFY76_16400 [Cyanobacteria bacterium J06649_11]